MFILFSYIFICISAMVLIVFSAPRYSILLIMIIIMIIKILTTIITKTRPIRITNTITYNNNNNNNHNNLNEFPLRDRINIENNNNT